MNPSRVSLVVLGIATAALSIWLLTRVGPRPSEPSRRPRQDDASVGPEDPAAAPTWAACRGASDEELRACLDERLPARVDPLDAAAVVCSQEPDWAAHAVLLEALLERVPSADALDWLDRFQQSCPRFRESPLYERVLSRMSTSDPAWVEGLRSTLRPETLFDEERDQVALQLAAFFARQPSGAELRGWLEAGSRGELRGTPEQMQCAAGISASLQAPGEELFLYLSGAMRSPRLSEESGVGDMFASGLLDPRSRVGGDCAPNLRLVRELLDDARFQASAAALILGSYQDEPPEGCDSAGWSEIRERAREISAELGLKSPR